ncbi:hypothetical protein [Actinoplanes sp. NPDC026619]|uniref:hypothetical protein n=1 Tax=Actinoplanes sp. NPDC026619 TaxID=3155798 RepID=UPI0033EE762C
MTGRRFARFLALPVLIAAVVAAWTPAGRLELRRSFTRMPSEYAELYFTGVPVIQPSGTTSAAVVSVTLLDHGAAERDFQVRFTLTGPSGAVVSSATAPLRARPEVPADVLRRLTIPGRARTGRYLVHVSLIGQPQTLHYRIDSKEAKP